MRPASAGFRLGEVLHDEDLLAWPDQAKLAPCDRFDGRGVSGQEPSVLSEALVLGSLEGDRARKLLVLTADEVRKFAPYLTKNYNPVAGALHQELLVGEPGFWRTAEG